MSHEWRCTGARALIRTPNFAIFSRRYYFGYNSNLDISTAVEESLFHAVSHDAAGVVAIGTCRGVFRPTARALQGTAKLYRLIKFDHSFVRNNAIRQYFWLTATAEGFSGPFRTLCDNTAPMFNP